MNGWVPPSAVMIRERSLARPGGEVSATFRLVSMPWSSTTY
jgi:hypothetical protein